MPSIRGGTVDTCARDGRVCTHALAQGRDRVDARRAADGVEQHRFQDAEERCVGAEECGVERPLLDAEDVASGALDPARDAVAVHRALRKGLADEQLEGALQQPGILGEHEAPSLLAVIDRPAADAAADTPYVGLMERVQRVP
jgi:hypothetical protein